MVQLELHIGAHVKSKDGKKLGEVHRWIVHPDTNQVDGFLLGKGHFSTLKIVAIEQVESATADGVVFERVSVLRQVCFGRALEEE